MIKNADVPITNVGDAEIKWVVNRSSGAKELTVGC